MPRLLSNKWRFVNVAAAIDDDDVYMAASHHHQHNSLPLKHVSLRIVLDRAFLCCTSDQRPFV